MSAPITQRTVSSESEPSRRPVLPPIKKKSISSGDKNVISGEYCLRDPSKREVVVGEFGEYCPRKSVFILNTEYLKFNKKEDPLVPIPSKLPPLKIELANEKPSKKEPYKLLPVREKGLFAPPKYYHPSIKEIVNMNVEKCFYEDHKGKLVSNGTHSLFMSDRTILIKKDNVSRVKIPYNQIVYPPTDSYIEKYVKGKT